MSDKHSNPSWPWLQAIKNNKILVVVVVIQGIAILCLSVALSTLYPLKTIEPIYVEFQHSTNSFMVVQRAGRKARSNELLIAMFLRSYVSSRETVDKITEDKRYPFVMALSGQKVGEVFRKVYGNKQKGLYYQKGLKRYIHIISDNPLGAKVHQIIVETTDIDENMDKNNDGQADITKAEWIVTLRYAFYDQYVTLDPRKEGTHLLNPMGIQIEEYSIKKLAKTRESKH